MADLTADDAAWLRLFAGLIRKDEPHRSGAADRLDAIADTVDPPKRTLRDEVAVVTMEWYGNGDTSDDGFIADMLAVIHARYTAEVKALPTATYTQTAFPDGGRTVYRYVLADDALALGDALFAPVEEVQP